jgi:C4-dicarboxylate-specific signal transduction histidine kinase
VRRQLVLKDLRIGIKLIAVGTAIMIVPPLAVTLIAVPIKDGERVVGVATLIVDIRFLNDMIVKEKFGKAGYAFVIDHSGLIIAHTEATTVFKTNLQKSIDAISHSLAEISELAVRSVENAQEGAKSVGEVVQGIRLIAESSEKARVTLQLVT